MTDRPRPWAPIFAGAILVAVPAVLALTGRSARDVLRGFVLAEALIVLIMLTGALYGVVKRTLSRRQPPLAREIQTGHACHLTAEIIALIVFMDFSVHRIGKPMIDWHTPFLQVFLWFLLLAWFLMERKAWRPMS